MHGMWLLINVFWALVFFGSAMVVAVLIAWRLSGRWRIALGCVAVLVAVGVGFSMMAQYWVDHERTGVFVARALRSIAADMDDARVDEICRTSMSKIPAIGASLYLSVTTPMMPSTIPTTSRGINPTQSNEIIPIASESEEKTGFQYRLPGVEVPNRRDDVKPVS